MKALLIFLIAGLFIFPAFSQTRDYSFCDCTEILDTEGKYSLKCGEILMEEGKYENGKRSGTWTSRNTDGKIIIKANHKNDLLDGTYEQFHFKGDPKLQANFKDGFPHGKWTYFNEKGRVIKEGIFDNGRPIGLWKIYDKKGKKVISEHNFSTDSSPGTSNVRYFSKGGIARDDASGEWMVLFFPQRNISTDVKPLGGYLLAGDLFLDYLNIPFMYMNTYAHYEFMVTLEIEDSKVEIKNLQERKKEERFDPSRPSFPFIVQTNSPSKLTRAEHSEASLKLLKGRIKDVVSLSGPWITSGLSGTVEVQIPFVVNDIKK